MIRDANALFRLVRHSETVIKVAANSEVEVPIAFRDGVLDVERQLFYIGMPVEPVELSTSG